MTPNQFFHRMLSLMTMHQHGKSSYKRFKGSGDIVWGENLDTQHFNQLMSCHTVAVVQGHLWMKQMYRWTHGLQLHYRQYISIYI